MTMVDAPFSTRAVSVCKTLFYANQRNVEKTVLDCGAGGKNPPLYLFYLNGYRCSGIDIDDGAISDARFFEKERRCALNIEKCDMRKIDKDGESFGCCYSYNAIFHMEKGAIIQSLKEMVRVTRKGGLIYFNLLSKKDGQYGVGTEIGDGSFLDESDGVIHSYHDDEEMEPMLGELRILEKTYINTKRSVDAEVIDQSFIEYYLVKSV